MQPTMHLMEIALGVHCVYCHDDNAQRRDLDTKPVNAVARRMIQMVADINRTRFGAVTSSPALRVIAEARNRTPSFPYAINDVQVNTAVEDARFAKPAGTQ